jgi:hypothetical protein
MPETDSDFRTEVEFQTVDGFEGRENDFVDLSATENDFRRKNGRCDRATKTRPVRCRKKRRMAKLRRIR